MFFFQSNEIVALKVLKYGGLCGGLALCGCLDSENVQGQCVICLPVWPDALASERNESQESIYLGYRSNRKGWVQRWFWKPVKNAHKLV